MIEIISHLDAEVRILRAVLSNPGLIDLVPLLEPRDFMNYAHQMVWHAVRGVPRTSDLAAECAAWLARVTGAQDDNPYGLVSAELIGNFMHVHPRQKPVLDPKITQYDSMAWTESGTTQIIEDAELIRFSRRALDSVLEQSIDKPPRGRR